MCSLLTASIYKQRPQHQEYHEFNTPLTPRSVNTLNLLHSPRGKEAYTATGFNKSMAAPSHTIFATPSSRTTSQAESVFLTRMPPTPPETPPFRFGAGSAAFDFVAPTGGVVNANHDEKETSIWSPVPDQVVQYTPDPPPSVPRRRQNLNPLSASAAERRRRRQVEFLGGVKEKREAGIFEGRGDRVRV